MSLAASALTSSGPEAVFADQVVRDGRGRIVSRTETVGGVATTYSYVYDEAGRLTGVSTPGGQTEGFAYDESGGLVSRGVGILAQPFPVDGHGRPSGDGAGGVVSWSADGELTGLARPGGGQSSLAYDGFGRLKSITGGGSTAEYAYDGLGRRVALTVDGQLTRRFVYGAGLFPRARLDAAGDVLERYVYASQEHVPDLIVRRDGTRLRLITDTLGSVRAVVDADSGAVVQRLSYSAYGHVTQDTNPGLQPFGYKGAISDPAAEGAGLVWMGVRAYVPSLARFATPEPLGIAVAWNEHDALGGDPINLIDPDGHAFVAVPIIVGAGVGAIAAAAVDVATQIAINLATGCPWNNINWGSVGISAAAGAITGGAGAVAARAGWTVRGRELVSPGRDVRVAPIGNKWRDGQPIVGKLPHYHRRGVGGIGRHRPWETRAGDTSWHDRF